MNGLGIFPLFIPGGVSKFPSCNTAQKMSLISQHQTVNSRWHATCCMHRKLRTKFVGLEVIDLVWAIISGFGLTVHVQCILIVRGRSHNNVI